MISVIIPLYNKAHCVTRTLASVAKQSFTDYEIVVVDDGSTDGGAELIEGLDIPRLRLVRQQNAGVSAARNRGLGEAQGEFVAFLDSDDEWKSEHLATLASLAEKYPECSVFTTGYEFRYGDGQVSTPIIRRIPFDGEDGELTNYFEVASCSHPPLWTSAVMVRKAALQSVRGFPVGVKSGEDLLTWARLAVRFRIALSRKKTAVYYLGSGDTTVARRKNDGEDYVGAHLKELYLSHTDIRGLRHYLALWYKMRAMNALQSGDRRGLLQMSFRSLRYNPLSVKVYVYLLMTILPQSFNRRLLRRFQAR